MKSKNQFDADAVARKLLSRLPSILRDIEKKSAIERYLISVRSRSDFVAFYTVRLNAEQAGDLYRYLAKHLASGTCPTISVALRNIGRMTHTVELANASKVIASLDRTKPVYDKIVRAHLKLGHPGGDTKKALKLYELLQGRMRLLLRSKDVKDALSRFDRRFPRVSAKRFLTQMKKLDLMLWQMR